MLPHKSSSIYHAVGHAVFLFLEAMLTFEQRHIESASEALSKCLHVCKKFTRKTTITETIGKTFKKANYEQYTELEAHAELCSAEALLLKALLTFVEDETLSSMIKGGMKIRTCFNSYKSVNFGLARAFFNNFPSQRLQQYSYPTKMGQRRKPNTFRKRCSNGERNVQLDDFPSAGSCDQAFRIYRVFWE